MLISYNSNADNEDCYLFNALNLFVKTIFLTVFVSSVCYANTISFQISDVVSASSGDSILEGHGDRNDDSNDDSNDERDDKKNKKNKFFDGCNEKQSNKGKVDVCLKLKDKKIVKLCLYPKAADKLIAKDFRKKEYYYPIGESCDKDTVPAVCGNGIKEINEACDDGAIQTATCEANCALPACGDSILNELAGEQCDDGNLDNADGCDQNCSLEPPPAPVCGNSIVETGEACDEGGIQTATCEADCNLPVCGDAILNEIAGEQCDDGNVINGDGCDSQCKTEQTGPVVACPCQAAFENLASDPALFVTTAYECTEDAGAGTDPGAFLQSLARSAAGTIVVTVSTTWPDSSTYPVPSSVCNPNDSTSRNMCSCSVGTRTALTVTPLNSLEEHQACVDLIEDLFVGPTSNKSEFCTTCTTNDGRNCRNQVN